ARLMNAVVAAGVPAQEYGRYFDTVSICFSKGLGAPVGSALAGKKEVIARARRARKVFGGGMRQAGILAAAALYALDHHVARLAEDHAHAKMLAGALAEIPGISLLTPDVQTNLVIFKVHPDIGTAAQVVQWFKEQGLWSMATAPQSVRFCTHLDVS